MRQGSLLGGTLLIVLGIVFLVANVLGVDAWLIIGPTLLVAVGLLILWGTFARPRPARVDELHIPNEGADSARLVVHHGAGVLRLGPGAAPGQLVTGTCIGGVDTRTRREGRTLVAELEVPTDSWLRFGPPWFWRRGFEWTLRLPPTMPIHLQIHTGVGEADLDLTDVRVIELKLSTGASSTKLRLPANAGLTHARIEAGAASVRVYIPQGVAARIRSTSGLADVRIDRSRFPRTGDVNQSADFDSAINRVELTIQVGVGSLEIH
jgi:hypothetical protein